MSARGQPRPRRRDLPCVYSGRRRARVTAAAAAEDLATRSCWVWLKTGVLPLGGCVHVSCGPISSCSTMETAPPDSRAAKDDEAPPRRIRICDAHHHFWDLSLGRNPWLLPDGVLPTFRYGDYSAIRRNYLFSDFQRDSGAFDVACSVHVETEPARDKAVEESAWLTKVNAECGLPSAIVCAAWLDAPEDEVDALLAAQTQYALVKAVRHKPTAAPSPDALRKQRESNAQPVAGSMSDPCWRRGYALLAKYGLSFDLQVHWWHLDEAAQLARDFPDTIIVLNHTGLPADRSEAGLAGWRAALETFAAEPNTYLKISGIGVVRSL